MEEKENFYVNKKELCNNFRDARIKESSSNQQKIKEKVETAKVQAVKHKDRERPKSVNEVFKELKEQARKAKNDIGTSNTVATHSPVEKVPKNLRRVTTQFTPFETLNKGYKDSREEMHINFDEISSRDTYKLKLSNQKQDLVQKTNTASSNTTNETGPLVRQHFHLNIRSQRHKRSGREIDLPKSQNIQPNFESNEIQNEYHPQEERSWLQMVSGSNQGLSQKYVSDLIPSPARERKHKPGPTKCSTSAAEDDSAKLDEIDGNLSRDQIFLNSPAACHPLHTPLHLRQARENIKQLKNGQELAKLPGEQRLSSDITPQQDNSEISALSELDRPGKLTLKNLERFDREINEHSLCVDVSINSSSQQLSEEAVDKVEKWLFHVVDPEDYSFHDHSLNIGQNIQRLNNYSPDKDTPKMREDFQRHSFDKPKHLPKQRNLKHNEINFERHRKLSDPDKKVHIIVDSPKANTKDDSGFVSDACHKVINRCFDKNFRQIVPDSYKVDRYVNKNRDGITDVHGRNAKKQKSPRQLPIAPNQNEQSPRYIPERSELVNENGQTADQQLSGDSLKDISLQQVEDIEDEAGNVYLLEKIEGENRIKLKIRRNKHQPRHKNRLSNEDLAYVMKRSREDLNDVRRMQYSGDKLKRQLDDSYEDSPEYRYDASEKKVKSAPPKARKLSTPDGIKTVYPEYPDHRSGQRPNHDHNQDYHKQNSHRAYVLNDAHGELTKQQLQKVRQYEQELLKRKSPTKTQRHKRSPHFMKKRNSFDRDDALESKESVYERPVSNRHRQRSKEGFVPVQDSGHQVECHDTEYAEIETDQQYLHGSHDRHYTNLEQEGIQNMEASSYSSDVRYHSPKNVSTHMVGQSSPNVRHLYPTHVPRQQFGKTDYKSPTIEKRKLITKKDEFSPSTSMSRLRLSTPKSKLLDTRKEQEIIPQRCGQHNAKVMDMEVGERHVRSDVYRNYYGEITSDKTAAMQVMRKNEVEPAKHAKPYRNYPQVNCDYDMSDFIHSGNIGNLEKSISEQLAPRAESTRCEASHLAAPESNYGVSAEKHVSPRRSRRHSSGFMSLENVSQIPKLRVQMQTSFQSSGFYENGSSHGYNDIDEASKRSEDSEFSNEFMAEPLPGMKISEKKGIEHATQSKICKDLFAAKTSEETSDRKGISQSAVCANFKTEFKVPQMPSRPIQPIPRRNIVSANQPHLSPQSSHTSKKTSSACSQNTKDRLRTELSYRSKPPRHQMPLEYCQSTPIRPGTRFSLDESMSTIMGFEDTNVESREEIVLIEGES